MMTRRPWTTRSGRASRTSGTTWVLSCFVRGPVKSIELGEGSVSYAAEPRWLLKPLEAPSAAAGTVTLP